MSHSTATLLGRPERPRRAGRWHPVFDLVTEALVAVYGVPRLGNFRDPVREIFYILLSAKTADRQYRRTHRALRDRFPTLAELAAADEADIRGCIFTGGLANKRAGQVKRTAAALAALGASAGRRLRVMPPAEQFRFLTRLPGVGPKSALCVMMYSLDIDVFPVDVNVQRVAERMGAIPAGLSHHQAQRQLPALVPPGRSRELHIALVVHGRKVCLPRRPRCDECPIRPWCRFGLKKGDG